MAEKTLFLLDAMALIYRAHFAFSKTPRINSKGMNTGAVLGFTNTLLEIIQKEKPSHIAIAFDLPGPTFRHIEFPAYKAQREAQPEDISIAIPIIKKMAAAFNIPIVSATGFEADDVIGTLAKQAAPQGFTVFMMTSDKDYAQLVEEKIFVYKPAFLGNAIEIMGVAEVLEKWQIKEVSQVIDILGLQGDSVDNIPGIPGIGAKTAVKLLEQYGTVENLIANAHELKGKQKEQVIAFAEQGILSKKLATIDINAPIAFDENECAYNGFDLPSLKALFDDLEFKTLGKRLFGDTGTATGATETSPAAKPAKKAAPKNPAQISLFDAPANSNEEESPEEGETVSAVYQTIAASQHDYQIIGTPGLRKSLARFLSLQKEFCFDTETTGLDALEAELVGIAFSYQEKEAYYVPMPENRQEALEVLADFKEVLENPAIAKIGQNLKYDCMMMASYGIRVEGELLDTMLAHYLLEPDKRHKMDVLSESFLQYSPVPIEDLIGPKGPKQGNIRSVPVSRVAEYSAEDADITLRLKNVLFPMLKEQKLTKLYTEIEAPLLTVLADMERSGVAIDTEALKSFSNELSVDISLSEKNILNFAGENFNIASPKQLGVVLFEKLKLMDKPPKTKTGQYATNEETLAKLSDKHPIVQEILSYRELQKLKSTYVDALPALLSPRDGLLHTSYNQAVAATGRLSSTNPNLQNIPIRTEKGREIRKAFVPRAKGWTILSADYSQVELRIMAEFSQDASMIAAFREGRDIHAATAAKIYGIPLEQVDSEMRRRAKTANFGIIYGISAFGLSQRLNIPRKEATEIIESYFNEFSSVKNYMDGAIAKARENEFVETLFGRRRYLRDINSRNATERGFAERNAINAPIQGTAADIIKLAMIDIHRWMRSEKLQSQMIMQVHDELVFDVFEPELELLKPKVIELMQGAAKLSVPLLVEAGTGGNWLEAH